MEKVIIILLTSVTFSSSDDDNNNNSSAYFNPPEWIQGTFRQSSDTNLGVGFRFIDNDFCNITINAVQCYNKQLQSFANVGGIANVKETITDTQYSIEITLQSSTVYYEFRKISDIKIEWVSASGNFKLNKQAKLNS